MASVERSAVGDPIPANCQVMEIRVADLMQLFNTVDPTPFRQRDLDPNVEEFIVEWSREIPHDRAVALLVHLDQRTTGGDEASVVREAVHSFFAHRAAASRSQLRRLFRNGRVSLVIGLTVLTTLIGVAEFIGRWTSESGYGLIVHESLLIGGWVAMWRPLEVFLYDWWPIRAEARLFDRLAIIPVRVAPSAAGEADTR